MVYSLPTPVPSDYHNVKKGDYIAIDGRIKAKKNKPVFIHFFNPACPCSKFNIPHFKSLVKQYGDKATFAVAVMSKDNYTVEEIQDKFGLTIPVDCSKPSGRLACLPLLMLFFSSATAAIKPPSTVINHRSMIDAR